MRVVLFRSGTVRGGTATGAWLETGPESVIRPIERKALPKIQYGKALSVSTSVIDPALFAIGHHQNVSARRKIRSRHR